MSEFSDSDADSVSTQTHLPEDTDSDYSDTDHQAAYLASVTEEIRILEEEHYRNSETDSDSEWESDDEEETMIITSATLKALCSTPLHSLTEYDAIQVRKVKRSLINGLIKVPCDTHDYGRVYIIEEEEAFQTRLGDRHEALPIAPTRPASTLAVSNNKQY